MDANTVAAARQLGIDLTDHSARPLTPGVLSNDGEDLVLVMTREHLRAVIGIDPTAWPRTFTLKEIVRRASIIPPARPDEGLASWLGRVAEGRRAADLMRPDPVDDVNDPFGAPRREHERMLVEVDSLVSELVRLGPWRPVAAEVGG
jgi:protein-tyrosine-phosphatase